MTQEEFSLLCTNKLERALLPINNRELWIYGCGKGGGILSRILSAQNIKFEGFIDQNADVIKIYEGHEVQSPKTLNPQNQYVIVSLLGFNYSILKQLLDLGFSQNDCFFMVEHENVHKEEIIYKNCRIGRYTYGYEGLLSLFSCCSSIGSFCSISWTARVVANHPLQFVSSNPFFYNPAWVPWEKQDDLMQIIFQKRPAVHQPGSWWAIADNTPCSIGNDVWIGANVIIMPKVKIGNGAIIGAGAVVTKDIPDYAIVVGSPARVVKYRYEKTQIDTLNRIRWWDWPEEILMDRIFDFYLPIEEFIKKYDV